MSLRILFAGIPAFAHALRAAGHDLRCVVLPWLEEDDGCWALVSACAASGVPVLPARAVTADADEKDRARIHAAGPYDLVLVMNFDRRVDTFVLDLPRHGAWNVHPSLLPRLRGYNPYFWTILRAETRTGITVHRMTERFDDGDILARQEVRIPPEATAGMLHDVLHDATMPLLLPMLADLERGKVPVGTPQDHRAATTAPMPRDENLLVDVTADARDIVRLIRAATPHPGARLVLGGRAFSACGAVLGPHPPRGTLPGALFRQGPQVWVAAGVGSFRPLSLAAAADAVHLSDLLGEAG